MPSETAPSPDEEGTAGPRGGFQFGLKRMLIAVAVVAVAMLGVRQLTAYFAEPRLASIVSCGVPTTSDGGRFVCGILRDETGVPRLGFAALPTTTTTTGKRSVVASASHRPWGNVATLRIDGRRVPAPVAGIVVMVQTKSDEWTAVRFSDEEVEAACDAHGYLRSPREFFWEAIARAR